MVIPEYDEGYRSEEKIDKIKMVAEYKDGIVNFDCDYGHDGTIKIFNGHWEPSISEEPYIPMKELDLKQELEDIGFKASPTATKCADREARRMPFLQECMRKNGYEGITIKSLDKRI